MRKVIACAVFLAIILTTAVALGEGVDMIGKPVEGTFPIWLHGNKLDKDVIVIEGVSYAPVRVIGESLGLDVEFKDQQVFLNRKEKVALPNYKVMSDVLRVNQPQFYVIKDNEWYFTINAFGGYTADGDVQFDGKDTITVTMPWGKKAIFHKSDEYHPGIAGFIENDRAVVSLTALGLKPIIKGEEVWLERID